MKENASVSSSRRRTPLRIAANVGLSFLILLGFLCFFSAAWYVRVYGRIGFDSILFTLTSSLSGTQSTLIQEYLLHAALPAVLFSTGISLFLFLPWRSFPRSRKLQLLPVRRSIAVGISVVLSFVLIIHAAFNVELVEYIINRIQTSPLYESEYVDPNSVQIRFPEKKRNLIYIYLESMETSYLSKEEGGAMEESLIPELNALAQEHLNFSHNTGIGGLVEVPGTSWTVGAMVAQTSGVPLVTPDDVTDWQNGYGKDGVFLPGLTSLSNILDAQGYYQTLMVGSDADFGGRATYYETHGIDHIYDLYTARSDGIIAPFYFQWWGYEDKYLFEYAQQELLEISAKDEPFAFTMLTVDTHHIGGFNCTLCTTEYSETYENAIACSSRQVAEFVQWLKQQDFYENTTIIITGDHFSMDRGYFQRNVDENYARHGYNCFINAAATAEFTKNRQFSSLDMFPTTLAAMGCTIEGNRLGLGTNLFSNQPTLIEKYGYSGFSSDLAKRSDYYAEQFYTAQED